MQSVLYSVDIFGFYYFFLSLFEEADCEIGFICKDQYMADWSLVNDEGFFERFATVVLY